MTEVVNTFLNIFLRKYKKTFFKFFTKNMYTFLSFPFKL